MRSMLLESRFKDEKGKHSKQSFSRRKKKFKEAMDPDDEELLTCSVPECEAVFTEEKLLHKLPEPEEIRKEWLEICNITTNDAQEVFICGLHFNKEDYEQDPDSKEQKLKDTAVPSQNLPPQFEEYIPEEIKESASPPLLLKNKPKIKKTKKVNAEIQNDEEPREKRKRKPKLPLDTLEFSSHIKVQKLDKTTIEKPVIKVIPKQPRNNVVIAKRYCCIPNCTTDLNDKKSYHQFPKHKKIREQWITACQVDKTVKSHMFVCSAHFQKDDFLTGPNSKRQVLKSIAVPSLNLPNGGIELFMSATKAAETSQNANFNADNNQPNTIIYVPATRKRIVAKNSDNIKINVLRKPDSRVIKTKENTHIQLDLSHKNTNNKDIVDVSNQKQSDTKVEEIIYKNQILSNESGTDQCNVQSLMQSQQGKSKKDIRKDETVNINIRNSNNSNKKTFAITLCAGCGQYCKIKDDDLIDIGKNNIETLTAETLIEFQEISLLSEEEHTLLITIGIEICDKVLQNQTVNLMDMLSKDDELIAFTGINFELLNKLTRLMTLFEGNSAKQHTLSTKSRIVMCLTKLRINLSFRCLAMLFGVTHEIFTKCFFTMVKTLSILMEKTIYWTSTEELLKSVPKNLHSFKQTRAVLSCFEIGIEKQRCEKCQSQLALSSKEHETIKLILGIAPSGLIIFKSKVYENDKTDNSIFSKTNVLEHLDPVRDAILTDKSLNIETECVERNIALIKLPKLEKNKYFNKKDVEHIKNIFATRIHADRTLQRFKMYRIIQSKISWRILPFLNDISTVIAGLVNMKNPTPPDESRFKLSELIYK